MQAIEINPDQIETLAGLLNNNSDADEIEISRQGDVSVGVMVYRSGLRQTFIIDQRGRAADAGVTQAA